MQRVVNASQMLISMITANHGYTPDEAVHVINGLIQEIADGIRDTYMGHEGHDAFDAANTVEAMKL